jgi:hypothetical protein
MHTSASLIVTAERPGGGAADLPNTLELKRG